jgi:hypothetical protein
MVVSRLLTVLSREGWPHVCCLMPQQAARIELTQLTVLQMIGIINYRAQPTVVGWFEIRSTGQTALNPQLTANSVSRKAKEPDCIRLLVFAS